MKITETKEATKVYENTLIVDGLNLAFNILEA